MQVADLTFVLLSLILLSCMLAIYLLIKTRPQDQKNTYYRVNDVSLKDRIKMKTAASNLILDPYESKIIIALLNDSNASIDVRELNEILNLTKLSKENQRQRRHIVLKELNLKLFFILGTRETITRISSESDRRVKYYTLIPEITDLKSIQDLVYKQS
jgi:hypothetical protein